MDVVSEDSDSKLRGFKTSCCFPTVGFFVCVSLLLVAQKKLAGLAASKIKSGWVGVSLRDSLSLGTVLAQMKLLFIVLMQRYLRSN